MDTRNKILTLDSASQLARGTITLVTGYFDAIRAIDVRDLAGLDRPIVVAVLPLEAELMPQAARAEMVAALRMIDYVLTPNERDLDALIECLAPRVLVRLEAVHTARIRELIQHVHGRQTR
jgi:bifunctional ADP-heptose synthase (sugar kinase/adenylyltransferase)